MFVLRNIKGHAYVYACMYVFWKFSTSDGFKQIVHCYFATQNLPFVSILKKIYLNCEFSVKKAGYIQYLEFIVSKVSILQTHSTLLLLKDWHEHCPMLSDGLTNHMKTWEFVFPWMNISLYVNNMFFNASLPPPFTCWWITACVESA